MARRDTFRKIRTVGDLAVLEAFPDDVEVQIHFTRCKAK